MNSQSQLWTPTIENKKGSNFCELPYDYDGMIDATMKHGLHIDVTLDEGKSRALPQDKIDGFTQFAAATVKHYESDLSYGYRAFTWHIWNEPNLPKYADAAIFSQLMSKTCTAIRNARPKAMIMGPALGTRDGNIDYAFINGLFNSGNNPLDCINAFTIHPYRNIPPETATADYSTLLRV